MSFSGIEILKIFGCSDIAIVAYFNSIRATYGLFQLLYQSKYYFSTEKEDFVPGILNNTEKEVLKTEHSNQQKHYHSVPVPLNASRVALAFRVH